MHEATDELELVHSARGGDLQAFDELVRRHQEVAFRAAYLIVRDAPTAEDVVQEAFVRAYRGLGRFREGEPFRPWLLRIATNLALNDRRAAGRRAALAENVARTSSISGPAADKPALRNEAQMELWDAINCLPADDRRVLYLRYYLELPEREIATAIGKAPGTVKSRLSRASARLREVITTRFPTLRETAASERADE